MKTKGLNCRQRLSATLGAIIAALFLFAAPVFALDFTPPPFRDLNYQAKYVSQSVADPITITAGASKEVIVKIKNVGKSTWYATGNNYVSVYTVDPNYRASAFYGTGWLAKGQPAKISGTVKPGQTADVKIKLNAPAKAGDYTEKFYLAAENKTWIKSSYFYLKIKVVKGAVASDAGASGNGGSSGENLGNSGLGGADEAQVANSEYRAGLLAMTARQITAAGGQTVRFVVLYNNRGTAQWNNYSWQEAGSFYSGDGTEPVRVNIADTSWLSAKRILEKTETVAPDGQVQFEFYFRTPAKAGSYTARFQLSANGHSLDGGTLEVPLQVSADAPYGYSEPSFVSARTLINEPVIRVGLFQAAGSVKFFSPYEYQVFTGSVLQGALPPNTTAVLSYSAGMYHFTGGDLNFSTGDFLRMVPLENSQYFTLPDYSRLVSWKGNKNFNAYRGTFEFKYSPRKDAPYAVNELPLDLYIAGIGETSNGAAMEYIKAILTAARSYAYYHINNGVPADQRTFDVYATTADQLYLGYNSELLMPRVVQAQQATYGEMVTYAGSPVVTPYFGHSDGHTRTWSQVWGGADKPYLQSVECKYDAGESMWGHGVGLSAQDASERADKDGWTYEQLLKYYYTGTEVEKIY